jgi:crotonobetainyl-CoA:carnitine CoA-transferase CaiB-like acyl-CoA transferase
MEQTDRSVLHGIKVVEVAQVAAVPMAGRHLADFGADVIHIEPPVTGDAWRNWQPGAPQQNVEGTQSPYINYCWENFNRNKRSITLNLATDSGREILYRLLSPADVFLTNLRSFERQKFQVEYNTLHQKFPHLIYGSLYGYGKAGPEKDAPAYDTISSWARAGLGYYFSHPGLPPFIGGAALGDTVAALGLALGVSLALINREKTGVGQEVDTSLLHIGMYQLTYFISGVCATGKDAKDWGTLPREKSPNPLILPYETKDNRWLLLSMPQSDRYWPKFCIAIGKEELIDDVRFFSSEKRTENSEALFRILTEFFLSRDLSEWKGRLSGAVPYSPYQNFLEAVADPQVRINNMLIPFEHPKYGRMEVIDNPVRLSDMPPTIRTPAPEIGQHTEEILLEYGYRRDDIERFKGEGTV